MRINSSWFSRRNIVSVGGSYVGLGRFCYIYLFPFTLYKLAWGRKNADTMEVLFLLWLFLFWGGTDIWFHTKGIVQMFDSILLNNFIVLSNFLSMTAFWAIPNVWFYKKGIILSLLSICWLGCLLTGIV